MAGFMAGFGSAFAQSFSQGNQIAAQKEQDKFRMRYQDYISRRDEQVSQDKKNAQNVKLAKSIVEMTGQPPESWTAAYDYLSAGGDPSAIQKQFTENQAIVTRTTTSPGDTSGAAQNQDLTGAASASVGAQMQESGMQPPADGGIFGNLGKRTEALQPSGTGAPQVSRVNNEMVGADREIADVTGQSYEDVQKTMAPKAEAMPMNKDYQISWKPKTIKDNPKPWESNSLEDAATYRAWAQENGTEQDKVRAERLYEAQLNVELTKSTARQKENGTLFQPTRAAMKGPDGGWTGGTAVVDIDSKTGDLLVRDPKNPDRILSQDEYKVFNKQMEDDVDAIVKDVGKDVNDYQKNVTNFKDLVRTNDQMAQLASQFPEGLDLSGQIAMGFDRLKRAGLNLVSIVNPQVDGNGFVIPNDGVIGQLAEGEKAIEAELKGPLQNAEKVALAATLMDIKATRLAYMYGAAMGQEGRSVTQQEFQAFKENAMGRGNPDALSISASEFIDGQYKKLKDTASVINGKSAQATNFKQKWNVPSPFMIDDLDAEIANDPEVKTGMERFKDKSSGKSLNQTKQPTAEVKLPKAAADAGIDAEDWKYLTDEEKKLWSN